MLHLNSSILKKQKIIFLPNIPRRREGIMHIRESEHKTKSLHQNPTKSINKFFKIKDQILYAFRFVFSKRKEGKKEGSKEGMEKEKKGRRREGRGRREEEGEKKPQEIKIILFPPLFSPTHLTFVMLQRPPPPRGDHCKLLARFALCAYTWVREGRGADSGARLRRFDLCDLRK